MIQNRYRSALAAKAPASKTAIAERRPAVEREYPDVGKSSPNDWLKSAIETLQVPKRPSAYVLLSGGADLIGFRLRVAQSQTRSDMLPSCFDHALLIVQVTRKVGKKTRADYTTYHVPLRHISPNNAPVLNGIAKVDGLPDLLGSWKETPNLAILRFPVEDVAELERAAEDLIRSRLTEDFVTPLATWLGFLWGAQGSSNPLLGAVSVPSAAFVEACFARARQDVSPGVVARVISPESIWQARFWSDQYKRFQNEKEDTKFGLYVLNQPAASITWPSAEETNASVGVPSAPG